MCTSPQDDVCQGELPFAIDDKGGENAVGRGVMIARGVLVLPSMPKGEIVDQRLSLISTQVALGATQYCMGILSYQINIFWVKNDFYCFTYRDFSVDIWHTT